MIWQQPKTSQVNHYFWRTVIHDIYIYDNFEYINYLIWHVLCFFVAFTSNSNFVILIERVKFISNIAAKYILVHYGISPWKFSKIARNQLFHLANCLAKGPEIMRVKNGFSIFDNVIHRCQNQLHRLLKFQTNFYRIQLLLHNHQWPGSASWSQRCGVSPSLCVNS